MKYKFPLLLFFVFLLILVTFRLYRLKTAPSVSDALPTLPPTAFTSPGIPTKWGVYAGDDVNQFIEVQRTVGFRPDYLPVFVHWGNQSTFPSQLAEYAYLQNQTLVIYWEAMDYNVSKPDKDARFSYKNILSGKYDAYLRSFAASAQKYARPTIIIPFEEMNGDWYPWSIAKNGNTPQEHVAAYRYLHKFFVKAPNVQFAWVVNNESSPDTPDILSFYPGDKYVDIIGINGFNFGDPWQSFSQIFDSQLTKLTPLKKPLIIASMASAPGDAKASWIQDTAAQLRSHPEVVGWIWFNENKEKDWRLWSDPASLTAFKIYLLSSPTK